MDFYYSVVGPDPNWIRIQQLCGSGSAFRIQIRIPTGSVVEPVQS